MEYKYYNANDFLILRRDVMRPGMDVKEVMYDKDNHPSAIHLGVEDNGKVIACVSAYQEINLDLPQKVQYRIRALCVDEKYRMQGIARSLFKKIMEDLVSRGAEAMWFTARVHLVKFYNSLGFKEYGEQFLIPN